MCLTEMAFGPIVKRKCLLIISCCCLLYGCGQQRVQPYSGETGIYVLGPVVGATLTVSRLQHASWQTLQEYSIASGTASLMRPDLSQQAWDPDALYLLTASGGYDIDPSQDNKPESREKRPVSGDLHAVVSGQALLNGQWRISPLSEIIYRFVLSGAGFSGQVRKDKFALLQPAYLLFETSRAKTGLSTWELMEHWHPLLQQQLLRRDYALYLSLARQLYQQQIAADGIDRLLRSAEGYPPGSLCHWSDHDAELNSLVATGHINELLQLNGYELEQLARAINQHHVDRIFILGDLTRFGSDQEWQLLDKHFLSRLEQAYIVLPGNHEMLSNDAGDDSAWRRWTEQYPHTVNYADANFFLLNSSAPWQSLVREFESAFARAPKKRFNIALTHHNLWVRPPLYTRHSINFFPHSVMPALLDKVDTIVTGDVSFYFQQGDYKGLTTYTVGNGVIGMRHNLYYAVGKVDPNRGLELEPCEVFLPADSPWYTEPRLPTDPKQHPYSAANAPLPPWSQLRQ